MKILLINPTHPAIGSRIPHEHLPPLGLLALGGPLLDAGHQVRLLDADRQGLPPSALATSPELQGFQPDAVLIGHSGSTSGHPSAMEFVAYARALFPHAWIIYGGVFPTYHWLEVMNKEPQVDFIVRGEGEQTIANLVSALQTRRPLSRIPGVVFRRNAISGSTRCIDPTLSTEPVANESAPLIQNLDEFRIGWELIDHSRYTYWGDKRAVVVQFSRGCPHHCHYCGQRVFWQAWRHRDPVKFAAELARLHREHGVEVINFADENPTASRAAWETFLRALIAENVPLILVGSTRASDIVRDADLLPLYKKAGVARFLLGIESTDEATLRRIQKGSTQAVDREAIRLLRKNGIISMAAWVSGFAQETDRDYWRTLRQLLSYDPDQIQGLYATPHSWTRFATEEANRRVMQPDLSRWDYKHQVLESPNVPNWRVLLWMKCIEAVAQLRPKSIWRLLAHPDPGFRAAMRWYYRIGRQVWPYELWHWLFSDLRTTTGPTVSEFLGLSRRTAIPKKASVPVTEAALT
jgi:anaerobic magnesium-protoporphyrin IX monomethyl ester cyclase